MNKTYIMYWYTSKKAERPIAASIFKDTNEGFIPVKKPDVNIPEDCYRKYSRLFGI